MTQEGVGGVKGEGRAKNIQFATMPQFPHKSVNLFFISVKALTDFWGT
jgi:hypothetical protein